MNLSYCNTTCIFCGSLNIDGKCQHKHDGTTCIFCGSLNIDGKCVNIKHNS